MNPTAKRIQTNINLSPGQRRQLDDLAAHFGSDTAAIRAAIDFLWRDLGQRGFFAPADASNVSEDRPAPFAADGVTEN